MQRNPLKSQFYMLGVPKSARRERERDYTKQRTPSVAMIWSNELSVTELRHECPPKIGKIEKLRARR